MADIKIVADYSDLQLMRRELLGVSKDAKASASVFEREFSRVERQLVRQEKEFRSNAASSQALYNKLLGLGRATKSASASASVFEKELKRVDTAAKRTTSSINTLGRSNAIAGKRVNRMGANLQQVGYQVGDFAVQIQGGTNAAVALGQQGAQLLGIFGAGGALAGAALAIGTAFIAPLLSAGREVDKLSDRLKELGEEIKELQGFSLPPEYVAGLARAEEIHLRIIDAEDELLLVRQRNADVIKRNAKNTLAYQSAQSEIVAAENVVNRLLEKRTEIQDQLGEYSDAFADKIQLLHDQEQRALADEVALLSMKIQFGKESLVVRELEKQQILEAYKEELKRLGLSPRLIQGLLDQKSAAMGLADQLERAAEAMAGVSGPSGAQYASQDEVVKGQGKRVGGLYGIVSQTSVGGGSKGGSSGDGGGGKSPQEQLAEYLEGKRQELELETKLVGIFGTERSVKSELFEIEQKYGNLIDTTQDSQLAGTLRQIEAEKERNKVLKEAVADQQSIADTLQSSMSDAFMSMVDGTKSFKDAMKDMARAVIKQLYEVLVVQQLVGNFNATTKQGTGLAGMIMGAFQADGGAWQGGSQIQAYANGGVVGGPTTFPMAGGKTGLMGEAGPEAIMPLKRGANGKLGVQMEGGGGDTINVVQNFNFQANGDDTVKKLIAQAAPKIAQMTKSSLLDDRRRGGSTKAAFG